MTLPHVILYPAPPRHHPTERAARILWTLRQLIRLGSLDPRAAARTLGHLASHPNDVVARRARAIAAEFSRQ